MNKTSICFLMDVDSFGNLILQELRLIRNDIKKEVSRLCNEIKLLHSANAKQTVAKFNQKLDDHHNSTLHFEINRPLERNQCTLEDIDDQPNANCLSGLPTILSLSGDDNCTDESELPSLNNIKYETSQEFESSSYIPKFQNDSGLVTEEVCVQTSEVDMSRVSPICFVTNAKPQYETNNHFDKMKPENIPRNDIVNDMSLTNLEEPCKDSTNLDGYNTTSVVSWSAHLTNKESASINIEESSSNFKCKFCTKSFSMYSIYLIHLKKHAGKESFSCKMCSKTYSHKSSLSRHIIHCNGKKRFSCEYCEEMFVQKSDLNIHNRIHDERRRFVCDICSKRFTRLSHLTDHTRTHTGEKPYTCNVCDKSFSKSSNLKSHTRIHTGERPYTCSLCNRSFAHLSHLTDHTRIHTGEKPYTCNICSKRFTKSSNLKTHIRIHNKRTIIHLSHNGFKPRNLDGENVSSQN